MIPFKVIVSDEIRNACPQFFGTAVYIHLKNSPSSPELWNEIDKTTEDFRERYTKDSIKDIASIQATREAYRRCGKDPSRYRPSSESLCRRILTGKDLYKVDTVVDLINLASMVYGYCIGGFDADKLQGDTLTLGIGREGEPYEGIGRGPLNIAGLPVYRDAAGGFGTPTSDHERTKLHDDTTSLLALVNGYDGNEHNVHATARFIISLAKKYAGGHDEETLDFHG